MSMIRTVDIPISFTSTTGHVVDEYGISVALPEQCLITNIEILRRTAWDALNTFLLGTVANTDWLVKNFQHGLTDPAPDVNTVSISQYVNALTGIYATWDQGIATQGEGIITIQYIMLR